jgi:hypothetical protein
MANTRKSKKQRPAGPGAAPARPRPRLKLVHDADAAPARAPFIDHVLFDKSQILPGVSLLNVGVREGGSRWVVLRITTHRLGGEVGAIVEGVPAREVRFLSDAVTLRKAGTSVTRTMPFGGLKYNAVWQLPR